MDLQDIEFYFQYHPPKTEERQQKHDRVNKAALEFAKVVAESVKDEQTKRFAIFAIQQARMFANLGITVDEVKPPSESGAMPVITISDEVLS
jgi:N-acyl-L-homoserine lactone synthetase